MSITTKNVRLTLTQKGYTDNIIEARLPAIKNIWYKYAILDTNIISSFSLLHFLLYFISFFRILFLVYGTYLYFFNTNTPEVLLMFPAIIRRACTTAPQYSRQFACRAHHVDKANSAEITQQTKNMYQGTHPILVEDSILNEKNEPAYVGHYTHGPGGPGL